MMLNDGNILLLEKNNNVFYIIKIIHVLSISTSNFNIYIYIYYKKYLFKYKIEPR